MDPSGNYPSRGRIAHNACISACAAAGRWQIAGTLLEEMLGNRLGARVTQSTMLGCLKRSEGVVKVKGSSLGYRGLLSTLGSFIVLL